MKLLNNNTNGFSGLSFFPCHRRPPNFNLTILQTKIISYLATLILILI